MIVPGSLKQKLGVMLFDWPRYEREIGSSWINIRNRHERLRASDDGRGAACQWQWTSDLHAPKIFPSLGRRLMKRALDDWPIRFAKAPAAAVGEVQVSFIIGHRGLERIPHLLATLATIAAQQGANCECIVVEQSEHSQVAARLPAWVRYVHTPLPVPDMPYCRAWTLNVGAREARGKLLVFHDNDILVPAAYAAELWARFAAGYEIVNLKRFIFYLGPDQSAQVQSGHALSPGAVPESIMQNAEAGGSSAVARDAFFAIGGYDESFVGWGGEDNEFWERALTRRVWPYTYMPLVHLWHAPQPGKAALDQSTAGQFRALSGSDPRERISRLVNRRFGNPHRMDPEWTASHA